MRGNSERIGLKRREIESGKHDVFSFSFNFQRQRTSISTAIDMVYIYTCADMIFFLYPVLLLLCICLRDPHVNDRVAAKSPRRLVPSGKFATA